LSLFNDNFSTRIADPRAAVARVSPGRWGVGVSGGADSVALLALLRSRGDLQLHIVHLDHETRAGESAQDAAFVRLLCQEWGVACTIMKRSEIEPAEAALMNNRSARYRQARLALFRRAIGECGLSGIILAHHADDQAETILQRLLRGGGPSGLMGMSSDSVVSGVRILRPLLGVRRDALRAVLRDQSIGWREDSSNVSMKQARNRVRVLLGRHPHLSDCALELGRSCAEVVQWMRSVSPVLEERFDASGLRDLPAPLAMESARRWLTARAGAGVEISPGAARRLITMASDAATAPRQDFPGGVRVTRRGGMIGVDRVVARPGADPGRCIARGNNRSAEADPTGG
jgi:tRNA(Ile)-lysidine synthase